MEYMVYSIILICGVVLTVQLVKIIMDGFNSHIYKDASIVIMVDDKTDDIEIIVRNMIWNSETNVNIILVDAGATDESADICRRLEELYGNVVFCDIQDVQKILLQIKSN